MGLMRRVVCAHHQMSLSVREMLKGRCVEEGVGFSGQGGREASGAAVECVSVAEKFACQVGVLVMHSTL
jgi:hypothetical protein